MNMICKSIKEELIELQKLYKKLYGQGLVGVSDNYVHVNIETFKKFCPIGTEIEIGRNGKEIELSFVENDVVFMTLI